MTLKVLHIASGDLWGGAESMVHALACEQNRVDPGSVECVVTNPGRLVEMLHGDAVPVTVFDESNEGIPSLVMSVSRVVRRFSPQVLHSHRQKEHLIAWFASRLFLPSKRPKLVGTIHGMPEPSLTRRIFRSYLTTTVRESVLRLGFDAAVAVSDEIARTLAPQYPKGNITRVHNGVRIPDSISGVTTRAGAPTLHLVALGRLVPIKRFDRLARLSDEVLRIAGHRPAITLAGEGPLRDELHSTLGVSDPSRLIAMPGFVADTDGLLGSADGLLITSDHEGIPMAALEALALGLPVFGYAVGGLPEIAATGVPMYLAKAGDDAALARAIVTHFTKLPPGTRVAPPSDWQFDIRQCAAAYQRLYKGL